jgi:CRP-like cAMP-binding protein
MDNALIRKFERLSPLSAEDRALLALATAKPYTVGPRQDIIAEGQAPDNVHLIVSGMACRQKITETGNKQIVAYLLPGDFCDLHVFILDQMDHTITTLTECMVVDIPRDTILRLTERPAIARALWWATLVDEGTLREALVNMGQRQAEERMAHFLCEMLTRLDAVGLVVDNSFDLPVTQADLGDTLGLSTVHINRTLQKLRERNLVIIDRRSVTVLDPKRLKASCGFNPNYLHLGPHVPKVEPRRTGEATRR